MTDCPAADGSSARQTKFAGEMPMCIDVEKSYTAEIVTNHGTMTAFLHPQRAPRTVNNFVCLARYHYYDGLIFHRIIREFMIQGGCPEGSGRGGPGYRFADEPVKGEYTLGATRSARWRWPTPVRTRTAASSSSSPAPTASRCRPTTRSSAS